MADLVAFGKRLTAAREAKKLATSEVAARTEIPIEEIVALEEGRRQTPEPYFLWILADVYGVDYKDLMIECGNLIIGPKSAGKQAALEAARDGAAQLEEDRRAADAERIAGLDPLALRKSRGPENTEA